MLKKIFCFILIVSLCITPVYSAEQVQINSLSAQSAILVEQQTGRIIFERNSHQQMTMASTTKILTGLIAIESADKNRKVTITKEMVMVEGTSAGLMPGDVVTMEGLLYGLLLQSGNDAANSIAIAMAGSLPKFAEIMNKRAAEIGMKESHFVTPSGLDAKDHYTTAYDMALLTATAMGNPEFSRIVSTKKAGAVFGNPPVMHYYYNHNSLLDMLEGADGVKTGFTRKSGRCLVSSCTRNGVRLIAVTLNSPNDWNDHKSLINYGFSKIEYRNLDTRLHSYSHVAVAGGIKRKVMLKSPEKQIPFIAGDNLRFEKKILLPNFIYAPVKEGDLIGTQEFYMGDRLFAIVPIYAAESDEKRKAEPKFNEKVYDLFMDLLENT